MNKSHHQPQRSIITPTKNSHISSNNNPNISRTSYYHQRTPTFLNSTLIWDISICMMVINSNRINIDQFLHKRLDNWFHLFWHFILLKLTFVREYFIFYPLHNLCVLFWDNWCSCAIIYYIAHVNILFVATGCYLFEEGIRWRWRNWLRFTAVFRVVSRNWTILHLHC